MAFTNPGKIVRLRSRPNGRGSVYEANMWAQQHSDGLFSGRGVVRNTVADMNVLVGGTTDNPDVVLGKLPSGFLIALDIVGQQVIRITAPSSNKRIASVVAYSDNIALNSTDTNTTGSPSSCGLIVVYGSTSATPVAPTESQIRQAVTQDGATGSQAVIAVIANITTESSTTTITDEMIAINYGKLSSHSIDLTTIPDNKYTTTEQNTGKKWIDGRTIYRKVVRGTVNMTGNSTSRLAHGIQGLTNRWELISYYGNMRLGGTLSNSPAKQALPYIENTHQSGITSIDSTEVIISGSYPWGNSEVSLVLEYVK